MPAPERKSLDSPDDVRTFEKARLELVAVGGGHVGRITAEPGWRWTTHMKAGAGTDLCQAPHFQYVLSGRLHAVMEDGTEIDYGPGDVGVLPPGHDAWVVGDEPVVAIDWGGAHHWGATD